MNKNKSMVFFLNTNRRLKSRIVEILEFELGEFAITYLGVPLFAGRGDNKLWEEVINKCQHKATSWKNRWLSQAERIQMIKVVLSAIPTYYMSC